MNDVLFKSGENDLRYCICADPEHCTEPIPGYVCRRGTVPKAASPDRTTLRENLAALCHEQWSGWMKHLFSKSSYPDPRGAVIPGNLTERWMLQMNTPYAELSEAEKESDRAEADRILNLFAGLADATPPERDK